MNAKTTSSVARTGGRGQSRFGLFEQLEARQMFASVATLSAGTLKIVGTDKADHISVTPRGSSLVVDVNGKRQSFTASKVKSIAIDARRGDDDVNVSARINKRSVIKGGDGDDMLYAGGGKTQLNGGRGDDTLVSVGGSTADHLTGGDGWDSFWQDGDQTETNDADWDEVSSGSQHLIESFEDYTYADGDEVLGTVSVEKRRDGRDLDDPIPDTDVPEDFEGLDFEDHPLFGRGGPIADDVKQGQIGDCYLLSTLSSIAKIDPDVLRETVVSLGDGSYAVQFFRDGLPTYVRVDADLVVQPGKDDPYYAGTGSDGSIWVAMIEKAYAYFRSESGSYDSINSGWMTEAYEALGFSGESTDQFTDEQEMLDYIGSMAADGKSVTVSTGTTVPGGSPLMEGHAYSVDHVELDEFGFPVSVVLRNPWGKDASPVADANPNDGYVTVSATQLFSAVTTVQSAWV